MTIRRIFHTYRRVFTPIPRQRRQDRLGRKWDPNPRRNFLTANPPVSPPQLFEGDPSHVRYQHPTTVGLCA